jgi:hypothetical protein
MFVTLSRRHRSGPRWACPLLFGLLWLAFLWYSTRTPAIQQALLQATSDGAANNPAPVNLEQIALAGEYALATWTRGDDGGQALLRWEEGSWNVLIHEKGWLGLRRLTQMGVPGPISKSLLDQIDPNWPSYEPLF